MLSEIIGAFKDLARLVGLPMFTVLIGFFILIIEIFIFGVLMLFELWRIKEKMIDLNCKTSLPVQSLQNEPENERGKEIENEPKKKKHRYKWK